MPDLIVGCCYGRRFWELIATEVEEHDQDSVLPLPTHVYIRGSDWAVEAVPPRVRTFVPAANPHPQVREYTIAMNELGYQRARTVATTSVGRLYNVAGLLACLLYERTGLAVPTLVRWRFCSQLVAEVLRAAGLDVLGQLPDHDITPARLEAWLVRSGATLLGDSSSGVSEPAPPGAVHG